VSASGLRAGVSEEATLTTPAVLALEDGTVFRGVSIGAAGTATGEKKKRKSEGV
jgi:hypothetical protein